MLRALDGEEEPADEHLVETHDDVVDGGGEDPEDHQHHQRGEDGISLLPPPSLTRAAQGEPAARGRGYAVVLLLGGPRARQAAVVRRPAADAVTRNRRAHGQRGGIRVVQPVRGRGVYMSRVHLSRRDRRPPAPPSILPPLPPPERIESIRAKIPPIPMRTMQRERRAVALCARGISETERARRCTWNRTRTSTLPPRASLTVVPSHAPKRRGVKVGHRGAEGHSFACWKWKYAPYKWSR